MSTQALTRPSGDESVVRSSAPARHGAKKSAGKKSAGKKSAGKKSAAKKRAATPHAVVRGREALRAIRPLPSVVSFAAGVAATVVVGGLVTGTTSASGVVADPQTPTAAPASDYSSSPYSSPSYTSSPYSSSYSSPSYSSPSYASTLPGTFTDGTYEVGSGVGEIAPGTYKTSGGSGTSCYFARLKDTAGDSIIDNNNSSGPMVTTVKKSDGAVEFSGGCSWTKK